MVLDDEGERNFLWCVIGIAIGVLIGIACMFNRMHDIANDRERSRNDLWHQAILRGYAEQLETEDGKPAYRWKEK